MPSTPAKTTPATRLRNAFRRPHLLTLWTPLAITLAALAAAVLPYPWTLNWVSPSAFVVYAAGLVYLLVLAILRFCRKRVAVALATLAALGLAIAAIVPALLLGFSLGLGGSDRFAEGLTVPTDIGVADPLPSIGYKENTPPFDPFQTAVRQALSNPPPPPTTPVTLQLAIPSLAKLHSSHPDLLRRYLAAHPAWRVFTQQGHGFATRRWMAAGHWVPDLNGYYSDLSADSSPRFQSRTTIGLDGTPWAHEPQFVPHGTPTTIDIRTASGLRQSHIALQVSPDLVVEQFEQSATGARSLTTAAFAQIEAELAPLAAGPSWQTAKSLLPDDAITTGLTDTVDLAEGHQPGNYFPIIRANPGEPGHIYLKAFEVTRGDQLSETRLADRSNEHIGWSDEPAERFLSTTDITIFEGDWDQPYAARFEVWFQPDSAKPERKLVEKIYKIEGWMH